MVNLQHTYSQNTTNQRILILGPTPPPLGGVTVHIARVAHKLRLNNVVKVFVTTKELRYRALWLYVMRVVWQVVWFRPTVVHYHTSYVANSLPELKMLVWLKKWLGFNLVLIEHDCRHLDQRSTTFLEKFRTLLQQVNHLVLIGTSTHAHYERHGMFAHVPFSVESAFLPPDICAEQAVYATYPKSLHTFLQTHHPILLANAFQLSFLQDKDLYGFDVCIEVIKELSSEYPQVGMVFALATIGNRDYFMRLQKVIADYGLQSNVYFLLDQKELWPLLKKTDVFLRPTLSDGASVSVEEARYLGTAVVASNVCWRPEGVTTYAVGDVDDIKKKVSKVLHEQRQ